MYLITVTKSFEGDTRRDTLHQYAQDRTHLADWCEGFINRCGQSGWNRMKPHDSLEATLNTFLEFLHRVGGRERFMVLHREGERETVTIDIGDLRPQPSNIVAELLLRRGS